MKKVYIVWTGKALLSKSAYIDEVFTNKREAEKYMDAQNKYWKAIQLADVKTQRWIYWIQEIQVRAKAILRGSQK